ncbi:MAG: trypsin-like peptidase domain-containing protein, partial [Pirellulales bacterium]
MSCREAPQTTVSPVRRPVCILLALLVLVAALGPTSSGWAQLYDDDLPRTQEELDRYYADLADDVGELQRHSNIIKRVAKIAKPSVVHIDAQHSSDPRRNFTRRSGEEAGSGVIIAYNGKHYVLTNRHLIKHADESTVTIKLADNREIKPTKLWTDAGTDVAVMELDDVKVQPARLGDASQLEVGDFVLAIGSPFGLRHSVSYGIVSAMGRRDLELATDGVNFQNFIQTDAAINPGNSGGPLINLKGEVVGINTAIASSSGRNEGIGFSIPINMAMVVARQLIERGEVS